MDSGPARSADPDATILGSPRYQEPGRAQERTRARLGEVGHGLGREALSKVAIATLPDTILGWDQKLVARKIPRIRSSSSLGADRQSTKKSKN